MKTITEPLRSFNIDQARYAEEKVPLAIGTAVETFMSARAALAWVCQSRPDVFCAIYRAAQATATSFCPHNGQKFYTAVKYSFKAKARTLYYALLERESLLLRVYADASFAASDDLSSQLGYTVLLRDDDDNCHVLAYSRKRAPRMVRRILAGEVYSFADPFDATLIIRHDV